MAPLFLSSIFNIAEKTLDRVLPDPEAKAKAKLELTNQIANLDLTKDKQFQDFIVAYEGKGDAVHPVIQVLRGSVRPVLTYTLAGAFLYGFINPLDVTTETMDLLWKLNLISLSFWYGERALNNLGLNATGISKLRKSKDDAKE